MNKFLNDKDSARVGKTVMVFAVFVTVFVGFKCIQELQFFGNSSNDISNVSTIDVTGTGDAVALPDIAQENFTVEQLYLDDSSGGGFQIKGTKKRISAALTACKGY